MKGIVLEIHQDRCVLLKADGIYGRYLCDAPAQAQPGYFSDMVNWPCAFCLNYC